MKKKLNENVVKRSLLEAYEARLMQAMIEADVFDSQDRLLLSTGLKARDKKSGYEYTVANVVGQGDEAKVYLRLPDQPRVSPAPEGPGVLGNDRAERGDATRPFRQLSGEKPKLLVVTAKEFAKQFEVE